MTVSLTKKHKVLVDLLPALSGYAGIPQESRLLFKTMAALEESLQPAGLIYSHHCRALKFEFSKTESYTKSIVTSANFLYELIDNKGNHKSIGRMQRIKNYVDEFRYTLMMLFKHSFALRELNQDQFFDFVWRVFFSKTLMLDDFELLKKQQYFISSLNMKSMRVASAFNARVKLDTKDWDFVIFQLQRPVKVNPETIKIIRYHDSIPLRDMDVAVPGCNYAHGQDLLRCVGDSFYVCNSEPTREELLKIAPELSEKSATIAPIIASYQYSHDKETLLNVISRSFSSLILSEHEQRQVFSQIEKDTDFHYLLILATLEPRKNHVTLIRAWERLRAKTNHKLRLIIVGNAGWMYDEVVNVMRPYVYSGDIIHVEKILPEDMGLFYSHADAFVFPSFNEGFGCPPLEAMQCQCPVIVSDIPTHRWVYGDAALYASPYNVDAFVEGMERLLYSPQSSSLRQSLIEKGLQQVKRYSKEKIGEQWVALFDRLKEDKARNR